LGFLLPKQVEDKHLLEVWMKLNLAFRSELIEKLAPGVKPLITEDLG